MNEKQRQLLIGVAIVIIGMLLFPPFYATGGGGVTINYGYAFIFSPPNTISIVNIGLLFIQWLFVVAVGVIGWKLLKND